MPLKQRFHPTVHPKKKPVLWALLFCLYPYWLQAHAGQTEPAVSVDGKVLPYIVFAAGDIADCRKTTVSKSRAAETAELIRSHSETLPDFTVLMLGDATYPLGLPGEYAYCYEPTWGRFKKRTRPTPGNHEYYSPLAYGYHRYYRKQAGSQEKPYYSFERGNWHIVSLDSNLTGDAFQRQLKWLNDDLKKNRSSCTMAFWHHPLYSSGWHGNAGFMKPVWQILQNAKADIVLSGHDHHYERFVPQDAEGNPDNINGIRQFVVGTGGATQPPLFRQRANSEALASRTFGVLRLELNDTGYQWTFLSTTDSPYTDSGSGTCRTKPTGAP